MAASRAEIDDYIEELRDKLEIAKNVLRFYAEWENVTPDGKPRQVVMSLMYDGVPQATYALEQIEG